MDKTTFSCFNLKNYFFLIVAVKKIHIIPIFLGNLTKFLNF